MILAQILIVGFIGYGIGLGVDAIFGFFTINQSRIPFSLTWSIPAATALLILLICLTSAYIGIQKVSKVDPEDVFRA
jgi:putative ABC transport system permease protein